MRRTFLLLRLQCARHWSLSSDFSPPKVRAPLVHSTIPTTSVSSSPAPPSHGRATSAARTTPLLCRSVLPTTLLLPPPMLSSSLASTSLKSKSARLSTSTSPIRPILLPPLALLRLHQLYNPIVCLKQLLFPLLQLLLPLLLQTLLLNQPNKRNAKSRPVVFLQHSCLFICSSLVF